MRFGCGIRKGWVEEFFYFCIFILFFIFLFLFFIFSAFSLFFILFFHNFLNFVVDKCFFDFLKFAVDGVTADGWQKDGIEHFRVEKVG